MAFFEYFLLTFVATGAGFFLYFIGFYRGAWAAENDKIKLLNEQNVRMMKNKYTDCES